MTPISQKVFCAFCKLKRNVVVKRRSDWTNVLLSLICATFLTFLTWQALDPRGVVYFAFAIAVSEIFIYIRWRMGVRCPHCGFDPVLYKADRERAAEQVKQRLAELKSSGQHLLRQNNPFVNLPRFKPKESKGRKAQSASLIVQKSKEKNMVRTGRILSREI
jgi:hypothetical protein